MDEIEVFSGRIDPGLFFVETDKYIPLRGSGWYSQPVIQYCLDEKLIEKSDIKLAIYSTGTIKRNYFNKFIDNLVDVLTPYDTAENKFSKLAINSIMTRRAFSLGSRVIRDRLGASCSDASSPALSPNRGAGPLQVQCSMPIGLLGIGCMLSLPLARHCGPCCSRVADESFAS